VADFRRGRNSFCEGDSPRAHCVPLGLRQRSLVASPCSALSGPTVKIEEPSAASAGVSERTMSSSASTVLAFLHGGSMSCAATGLNAHRWSSVSSPGPDRIASRRRVAAPTIPRFPIETYGPGGADPEPALHVGGGLPPKHEPRAIGRAGSERVPGASGQAPRLLGVPPRPPDGMNVRLRALAIVRATVRAARRSARVS
jgi:hypothetical protein